MTDEPPQKPKGLWRKFVTFIMVTTIMVIIIAALSVIFGILVLQFVARAGF